MEKWNKYLHSLGLSDTESKVYLEVLKLGPSAVQDIAKTVGLSRVSVYSIIETLTRLGLMTSVEKGKKVVYAVEPPERIVALAENKINNMQAMVKEIKNNIQELKLVQSGDKPVVKMYEGSEAFLAIQEDVLNAKFDVMCEFGNIDEIDRVYPYEAEIRDNYLRKLSKMDINRQIVLYSKNPVPKTIEPNKKIKFLKEKTANFFGDIFMYGDTVWLSSFKNKQMSVMIKSKEIKDTLQSAFDILWKNLPE